MNEEGFIARKPRAGAEVLTPQAAFELTEFVVLPAWVWHRSCQDPSAARQQNAVSLQSG